MVPTAFAISQLSLKRAIRKKSVVIGLLQILSIFVFERLSNYFLLVVAC